MSTTYTPFLGIGKLFGKWDEVEPFLLDNGVVEYLDPSEDLEELSDRCGFLILYLEYEDSYFVGVKIHDGDPMEAVDDIYNAVGKFKKQFGFAGDLIHTVDYY